MTSKLCSEYRRLRLRDETVELTGRDISALFHHIQKCPICSKFEKELTESLRALRENGDTGYTGSNSFTDRVIYALRAERVARRLQVWQPAFAGAAAAVVLLFLILQMVTSRPEVNYLNPSGSARASSENPIEIPIFEPPKTQPPLTREG